MTDPLPRTAWDMTPAPQADIRGPDSSGWLFGTPPGITPEQWPLDPNTGYPMQHGFTLLLPKEYRVRGETFVAISFFGVAPEHFDGGPLVNEGAEPLVLGLEEPLGDHPPSCLIHGMARKAHPELSRFADILGGAFAIIDLTREEFEGPLCPLPDLCHDPIFEDLPTPAFAGREPPAPVALHLTARKEDPNVGIAPIECPDEDDAYESIFDDETDDLKDWAKRLGHDHIGGTAHPMQAYPELSPYYIEFDEDFGNFNFGTGNAQLCLKTLTFDWACD